MQIDSKDLVELGIALLSLLAAGNLYFIKRLVDKIDETDGKLISYQTEIAGLNQHIVNLQERIQELTSSLREITDLQADVAVLKFAIQDIKKEKIN